MEHILEIWSLVVILLAAFVIGWAAEAAQSFMPKALALTILAWLQTLPEFAVEASIAWNQQRDLMIANLTGSLRLLVGLGWPMIFYTHFFFQAYARRKLVKELALEKTDSVSVLFLFLSIMYFLVIVAKASLTVWDSVVLIAIYVAYLWMSAKLPVEEVEDEEELPWVARKIVAMEPTPKIISVVALFSLGGFALYVSVHPFIETLQKWALAFGISTFVFVQWLAPFLSEFPEKLTAFNWARQERKAPMAVMNMVSSNINQWTMLAALIPVLFNLSLGYLEPVYLDRMHRLELGLTIAQSMLGGLLLLDLKFNWYEALGIFVLWIVQFIVASLREPVLYVYLTWIAFELTKYLYQFMAKRRVPLAFTEMRKIISSWG